MHNGEKVVVSEQEFRTRFVYDHSDMLGEGGFAKVYKAYDRQFEETVALKFYTKSDADKYDIISEMKHSRKFTHKNIIRVHDACIIRFTNSFGGTEDVQVGILEFANAGSLMDFLETTPSEEEFKNVMIGILQGLYYLHTEKGVIHRDLSPDNILMFKDQDKWIPKIADFGISKNVDVKTIKLGNQKVSSELVGKMEYMAPEQFDPQKYGISNRISTNVDLWAYGIVLTEIFTHTTPFGDRNSSQSPMQIMHNVLHAPLPAQINNIPEPYRTVIRKCLVKEAEKRVKNAIELVDILSVQVQPRKKNYKALMVVGAFAALLMVGGVLWYFHPWEKNPQAQESPKVQESLPGAHNSNVEQVTLAHEEKPSVAENGESENQSLQKSAKTSLAEDKKKEEPIGKVQLKEVPEEEIPAFVPENDGVQKKEELVLKLANALKHLDNEIVKPQIRSNQISTYISEIFVHEQTPVILEENGASKQQEIQDFLEYVVKTAGVERRSWKIDETFLKLNGDKISELKLIKK